MINNTEWISVKNKLPPIKTDILVLGKNPYTPWRNKSSKLWVMNLSKIYSNSDRLREFLRQYKVTHFLIIPKIPKR